MGRIILTYHKYRYLLFIILAVAYIFVYFHRLCAAVVAVDMMEDLKTGGALMGLLGSAYFYPYAAMQLPAGLLSDSWGPRKTITLFFVIASIGSVMQGLAPTVMLAIAGRTLVGIGVAMLFVPTLKILSEWFKAKEFAVMTGFLIAMGGVGSLMATYPLAYLSNHVGWRASFLLIGGITLVSALFIWLIVRDRPDDAGFATAGGGTRPAGPRITLRDGVRQVISHPRFWVISVWFFFSCAVFFSFGGLWGGPYLMQVYGLSKSESGSILSMLAIGMIVGSPALSYVSDSIFKARKPVIVISSAMSLLVTAVLAFHTDGLPLAALYALCFLLGFFNNAIVVVGFTTSKELFPIQIAGTSTGLANLFPFLGGAVAQPFLGYLIERNGKISGSYPLQGYENAFFTLFICMIIAFAASLFIKETMDKK
ncbi:MAG TPA: MFS transporter [Spirochaetota bacterium]|nr:MFS transporter [Spirochaetota bacterium]